MLQVWRDERADLRRDWVNLSVPHLQKKIFSRRVGTIIPQQKGWIWKSFTKPTKHNFLRVQRMKEKQRRIYIKQRWKPKPREKRKNGWILETRRDGKTFWRIEESVANILIWTIRFLLLLTNIIKYKVILSAEIRWKYVYTLLLPLLPFSAVFPSRQISNILPFYRFFRSRGFGFRLR